MPRGWRLAATHRWLELPDRGSSAKAAASTAAAPPPSPPAFSEPHILSGQGHDKGWGSKPRGPVGWHHRTGEPRTQPEPTFPTLADPGQPAASHRRRQQRNPWGGSCPLTRRHTPGGRLRGGGPASQRLRLLKAERQWSTPAQRSAACGSFQSRTPCKRIGCVQRQSHVPPGEAGLSAASLLPAPPCACALGANRASERPVLGCGRDPGWSASGW